VAGAGTHWLPVALADDVLYVREDRVLAFEGSLSWEAGAVRGAALRMLQFRGRGTVALELDEAPVAIKITDERPTLLAGARLVGWVGVWCRTAPCRTAAGRAVPHSVSTLLPRRRRRVARRRRAALRTTWRASGAS
jgi:hypothetical protein